MAAPSKAILTLAILLVLGFGFYDYLANFESNGCEMTYMFQYPEYLNVPLNDKIKEKFPRYALHLYGEGTYAKKSRNFELSGIPVLFIPGNAGSHRQVRSLGSVAMKKAQDSKTDFHFNFFVLNLNEELSALFGGVLDEQTEFAHQCIKHILTLYEKSKYPPKSVVLVGHSMGGVIARALFTLKGFNAKLVHTIITQATPHQSPVMALDKHLSEFYQRVNSFWESHVNTTVNGVTVLSSGGGFRDIQVRHGLTSLNGIVKRDRSINAATMSVPLAWVSTDHLCAVWCKQMVMATVRALFDMVASSTRQIAENPKFRVDVLRHHFIQHKGPRAYRSSWPTSVKLDTNIKWDVRHMTSWRYRRDEVKVTKYLAVPVKLKANHSLLIVSNLKRNDWVTACRATGKSPDFKCEEAVNLSERSQLIPPLYSDKKMVKFDIGELLTFTHIVILVPKTKQRVEVMVETIDNEQRNLVYTAPSMYKFFTDYPQSLSLSVTMFKVSETKALFYNISIPQLATISQAFTAYLHTVECKEKISGEYAGNLMTLNVPWNFENTHKFIRFGENGSLALKLQTPQPPGFPAAAQLHLLLHPSCTYRLAIDTALLETAGQFLRTYAVYIPAFLVVQVLMVLSGQLYHYHNHGFCPSYFAAHDRYGQPFKVIPIMSLARMIFRLNDVSGSYPHLGIPLDDIEFLEKQGLWAMPVSLFLYFAAYALTKVHALLVHSAICVMATVTGFICRSCCSSNRVSGLCWWLHLPVIFGAIYTSLFHCASLGLLILYKVSGIKLLYLCIKARNSEKIVKEKKSKENDESWVTSQRSEYHLHFSLFILLMIVCVLGGPGLIVWIKNLRYSASLSVDPLRAVSVILCICYLILPNVTRFPYMNNGLYDLASWMLYFCCVGMLPYCMVSVYRLSYFISAAFIILTLIQLLGYMFVSTIDIKKKTN